MPVDHYENFPVASFLLPARLRRPVELIYWFARQADDFADEGELPAAERLALLAGFRAELDRIERGEASGNDFFRELGDMIRRQELPLSLFRDLLSAFEQDVSKTRYADFGEVMDYCRRSANPVGRLLLHLYGAAGDRRNLAWSDGICSALQLINFLQDVESDYARGRIYLPLDEMARYRVSEEQIARRDPKGGFRPLMMFQIDRARRMLQGGAPLGKALRGRIGLELRTIVMGGETILKKLHKAGGDVFAGRPVLTARDWPYMLGRALFPR